MAYLKILTDRDPTLRKHCREVDKITLRTQILLDDMLETMRRANGVGLAGPQVGVLRRIVVIECEPGVVYELINPVITDTEGLQTGREGCLSIPGKVGIVSRPNKVTVEATDRNGVRRTIVGEGLLARALCHEIDHLDGKLYTDIADRMLTEEEIESEDEA